MATSQYSDSVLFGSFCMQNCFICRLRFGERIKMFEIKL